MANADQPDQAIIEQLKSDLRKEMSKKAATWAIAGGIGVFTLAAIGAWTVLKPAIANDLGVVDEPRVNELIAEALATHPSGITEERVQGIIDDIPLPVVLSPSQIDQRVNGRIEATLGQMESVIPKGAVVAFDGFAGCPSGWETYTPATARVIVGAGNEFHPKHREWFMQLPSGGEKRERLPSYQVQSSGGELEHMLTSPEMPNHNHGSNGSQGLLARDDARGKVGVADEGPDWGVIEISRTAAVGGAQPHNNMPPYIALYFCKKEGG